MSRKPLGPLEEMPGNYAPIGLTTMRKADNTADSLQLNQSASSGLRKMTWSNARPLEPSPRPFFF
jgi:hypothetical protein